MVRNIFRYRKQIEGSKPSIRIVNKSVLMSSTLLYLYFKQPAVTH